MSGGIDTGSGADGIRYALDERLDDAQFVDLLERSGLAPRRPVAEPQRIAAMLEHANLLVSAWRGETPVGVARSLTDFHYCCYLSDLAVDHDLQRLGIGRELIRRTVAALRPGCKLILLAAPAAADYYPHVGFEHHPQAWVLDCPDGSSPETPA